MSNPTTNQTTSDGAARRTAFAEALACELQMDMDDKFMAASDRVLMQLWARGYMIAPLPEETA